MFNWKDQTANSNDLLKATTEELQLRTKIDGKNRIKKNEGMKDRKHGKRKYYIVYSWEKQRTQDQKNGENR